MQGHKLIKLLIALLPFLCYSQNREKAPLVNVLDEIATQHNIKFSYIDEELAVYTLVPPDAKLPLQDKLAYIEKRTRLKFEAVTAKYYTVYNDVRMDKPLCGYIKDAQTGLGVENAQIEIEGTGISVASNAEGYFSLPILSPNTIYIKHLGYQTKAVNPQELYVPDCPVITVEPIITELEAVVTNRYLATGISKNRSGELVVRPRHFGILPGLTEADVLQTMQQLPGVTSIDETVSNINVRGGTHDQNLFLWNGVRMYQTSHFFGLMSAFNPLPATNITIYKNGSPAFYGEGVSSSVAISTNLSVADTSFTTVAADMLSINLLSHLKLSEGSALQVSARRTYADAFETPAFKAHKERVFQNTTVTDVTQHNDVPVESAEDFYFYDLSVQYRQQLSDNHNLFVSGIGVENAVDIFQSNTAQSRTSSLTQKNFGGSIKLNSQWGNSHSTEVEAYISWYDLSALNEAIENERVTNQQNSVLDLGAKVKYSYSGLNHCKLSAGYQAYEIGVTNYDEINVPAFSRKSKEVSFSHAVIGEGEYTSPDGLTTAIAGIRVNYFDKFSIFVAEPRLAVSHELNNNLTLEAAAEQKSQTVSQIIDLQQDFLGIEKRRWVLTNDNDIPIQKSSQVSGGLTYTYNDWLITGEGFYKKVTGITSDSQAFQNQFEFTSTTGEYNVLGTEILLQKNFEHFYTWVSYSYNDNQYTFNGFLPPGFANNFAISHAVSFAGIYEGNNLKVALGAKWRTGKPITEPSYFTIDPNNPANSSITYSSPNSSKLNDILQVNFSANKIWQFKNGWQLTAGCSILNVLDRQNIINRYYRINRGNNYIESVSIYALGRTPNISLKITF